MTVCYKTHLFHFTIFKRKGEKQCLCTRRVYQKRSATSARMWGELKTLDKFLQKELETARSQKHEDIKTKTWGGKEVKSWLEKDKTLQCLFIVCVGFLSGSKEDKKNKERQNEWWEKDKIFINNWTVKSLEFCAVICRCVNADRLNPGETARERHAQTHMPARTSFRYR